MQRAYTILALVVAATQAARSQTVISLRAGLLNYGDGRIETTDGPARQPRVGVYHLRAGQELRTRRGRAELLLNPSVFLRVADDSRVSMECDTLDDVRVEVIAGTAIVDVVDIPKGSQIHIRMGGATAELSQPGVYRFDATAGEIRVFDGKLAIVRADAKVVFLKKGKQLAVNTDAAPAEFDRKSIDRVQRWSARRSMAVAQTNLISARTSAGRAWRRVARPWIWSMYVNGAAARSRPEPSPTGF